MRNDIVINSTSKNVMNTKASIRINLKLNFATPRKTNNKMLYFMNYD